MADVLLLYNSGLYPTRNVAAVMDYVAGFKESSKHNVITLNTNLGCPVFLENAKFHAIVLHYSLFDPNGYKLDDKYRRYLKQSKAYKLAIFQDEMHYCKQRFEFIDEYSINHIFTLVEQSYVSKVYGRNQALDGVDTVLTGYVSERMKSMRLKYAKPYSERSIDIGYRGRRLPRYLGLGSQEKADIADGVMSRVDNQMHVDISTTKHLNGDDWYKFLGDCKYCLGTMAGATIFDLNDNIRKSFQVLESKNDYKGIESLLAMYEYNIPYRQVSPRIFEAAALNTCQILFIDHYQRILEPLKHYIPLEKNYSNIGEVIGLASDPNVYKMLTDNCYNDLIHSGAYSYKKLTELFDALVVDNVNNIGHARFYIDLPVRLPLQGYIMPIIRNRKFWKGRVTKWLGFK